MRDTEFHTRRNYLRLTSVAVGTGLAGCSSNGSDSPAETQEEATGTREATTQPEDTNQETSTLRSDSHRLSLDVERSTVSVTAGDELTLPVTAQNTGEIEITQNIVLRVGDTAVDATEVTLGSGESTEIRLAWKTGTEDVGTHELSIEGERVARSANVTVREKEPAELVMTDTSAPEQATAGQQVEIDVTLRNVGDKSGEQEIELLANNTVVDSTNIELSPDSEKTATLQWQTETGDSGRYDVIVRTESEDNPLNIEIQQPEPAQFEVDIQSGGDAFSDDPYADCRLKSHEERAEITNTGEQPDTQTIQLLVNNYVLSEETVQLDPGETKTIEMWFNANEVCSKDLERINSDWKYVTAIETEDNRSVAWRYTP